MQKSRPVGSRQLCGCQANGDIPATISVVIVKWLPGEMIREYGCTRGPRWVCVG